MASLFVRFDKKLSNLESLQEYFDTTNTAQAALLNDFAEKVSRSTSTTSLNWAIYHVAGLSVDIITSAEKNSYLSAFTGTESLSYWYKVALPSSLYVNPNASSKKYTDAISDDGKIVYIQDMFTTIDNPVPFDMVMKNMRHLLFICKPTSSSSPDYGLTAGVQTLMVAPKFGLSNMLTYTPIEMDTTIPLTFKRANTVVNLGRL